MSCILFSLSSYEMLIERSELSRSVLRRFESRPEFANDFCLSWAEWMFNLNADAYRTRYRNTTDAEIEGARVDDADYEFTEVKDWNDPKEIGSLFGRIAYQCSEFSESHPQRASVIMLDEIKEAIKAEANAPAYKAKIAAQYEAERASHKSEVERLTAELRAKYPKAKPASAFKTSAAQAAANLRAELKAAFPGVKFSVKSSSYSGGNSIALSWVDGPSNEAVEAIASNYQAGDFDGMTDCYNYNNSAFSQAFREVCGSVRYVQCSREFTPDSMQAAIDIVAPRYEAKPPVMEVSSYDGNAYLPYDCNNENRHREIHQLLRASDLRF